MGWEFFDTLSLAQKWVMGSVIVLSVVLLAMLVAVSVMATRIKREKEELQKQNDDISNNQQVNQTQNKQPDEQVDVNNLDQNINQDQIPYSNQNLNNLDQNTGYVPTPYSNNENANSAPTPLSNKNNNKQNNQSNATLDVSSLYETDGYKKGVGYYPNGDKIVFDGEIRNKKLYNGTSKIYKNGVMIDNKKAVDGTLSVQLYDYPSGILFFNGIGTDMGNLEGTKYYPSGVVSEQGLFNWGLELIEGEIQPNIKNINLLEEKQKVYVGTVKNGSLYNCLVLCKEGNDLFKIGNFKEGVFEEAGLVLKAQPNELLNSRIKQNHSGISKNVDLNLDNTANNIHL